MIRTHCTPATSPTADAFEFPPGSGEWYEPNDIFRSRVLGLFPRQSAQSIWSEAWLQKAREGGLTYQPRLYPEIGCDVARYGDDRTTIYARRGPVVLRRESYAKQNTMETVGRIVRLCDVLAEECRREGWTINPKYIPVRVDDTGLGGVVTDRLSELGYSVEGIDFGGKALNPEEFFNRGSEMWFSAAYRARDMRLDLSRLPDDAYRRLSAELRARRYKIQSDKTLRAESKDDIKKRLGRSPDDADALMLAFASNTGWRMVDVSTPEPAERAVAEVVEVAKASRKTNPYLRQVQDLAPAKLFPERSDLEVCGNCLEFRMEGGKGRCKLRHLQVDAPDVACEFLTIRELGDNDEDEGADEYDDGE